jgi:hypothetical protein
MQEFRMTLVSFGEIPAEMQVFCSKLAHMGRLDAKNCIFAVLESA